MKRQILLGTFGALLICGCAWAQDPPAEWKRVQEVVRHDDGTVTAKFHLRKLKPHDLRVVLMPYKSAEGRVDVVGDALLVRDKPEKIAEMEKIADAFDVPSEPVTMEITIEWLIFAQEGNNEKKVRHGIVAKLQVNAVVGESFAISGSKENLVTVGMTLAEDKRTEKVVPRSFGITVSGTIIRKYGDRYDIELKVNASMNDEVPLTEKLTTTVTVQAGKATQVKTGTTTEKEAGEDGVSEEQSVLLLWVEASPPKK